MQTLVQIQGAGIHLDLDHLIIGRLGLLAILVVGRRRIGRPLGARRLLAHLLRDRHLDLGLTALAPRRTGGGAVAPVHASLPLLGGGGGGVRSGPVVLVVVVLGLGGSDILGAAGLLVLLRATTAARAALVVAAGIGPALPLRGILGRGRVLALVAGLLVAAAGPTAGPAALPLGLPPVDLGPLGLLDEAGEVLLVDLLVLSAGPVEGYQPERIGTVPLREAEGQTSLSGLGAALVLTNYCLCDKIL